MKVLTRDIMIETGRGEALAWEADELGHINMRFYFARADEARASLAHYMGLPAIYKSNSLSTLVPLRQHIRYLAEIKPGQKMIVKSGLLAIGENDCEILHIIYGHDETPAASIVELVSHKSLKNNEAFAWPKRVLQRAKKLHTNMPDFAQPKSAELNEEIGKCDMTEADKLDLPIIGRGAFRPDECDVFGYVRADAIIGRVSDCAQHLKTAWPDLDYDSDDGVSGALLEAVARHKIRPRAGDLFVMRSALRMANKNVRELCHWILDPVTGKCWSSFVGVACRFDIKTRKLVKIDDKTLALLQKGIIAGIRP